MLYAGKFEQHHTLSLVPGIVLVVASVVIMFHHHLDKKNPSFTRPTTKERQHTSSDKGFPWRTTRKKWHIFQLHFNFSRAITRASLQEKKISKFYCSFHFTETLCAPNINPSRRLTRTTQKTTQLMFSLLCNAEAKVP